MADDDYPPSGEDKISLRAQAISALIDSTEGAKTPSLQKLGKRAIEAVLATIEKQKATATIHKLQAKDKGAL